ncbi:MAG: hypothetical protein KDA99_24495, partial [Planctomycetales bacterium]|nr:hypothetical protein [Planctomycetales bacterium]
VRILQRLIDTGALPNTILKQDNSPAKSLSDLQQAYEQAEREAAKLAGQFQLPPHQGPLRSDGKPRLPIDTKLLMEKIEVAFDLSMQLQQAQLAEAEANLKLARERLARREQIKDKIIARRVEELTSSDDTSWQGTQTIERTLR